ncbi:MAG: STAS domain-containing protein [Candidatus Omnitrophica bacterium]|nr:STAS domain-containing protein [Candidatus Omnitrophota bacterium]MCM8790293.1 STAS domain-containing protein [Candidatus Omnitrophota bacterium]
MGRKIDIETKESILFLKPRGPELGPEEAEKLKTLIKDNISRGITAVVLNFSTIEYMSSIFLSALMEISKDLGAAGVNLGLAQLGQKILEILKVTKLDTIFNIFDDSYQAYIAFTKHPAR